MFHVKHPSLPFCSVFAKSTRFSLAFVCFVHCFPIFIALTPFGASPTHVFAEAFRFSACSSTAFDCYFCFSPPLFAFPAPFTPFLVALPRNLSPAFFANLSVLSAICPLLSPFLLFFADLAFFLPFPMRLGGISTTIQGRPRFLAAAQRPFGRLLR